MLLALWPSGKPLPSREGVISTSGLILPTHTILMTSFLTFFLNPAKMSQNQMDLSLFSKQHKHTSNITDSAIPCGDGTVSEVIHPVPEAGTQDRYADRTQSQQLALPIPLLHTRVAFSLLDRSHFL